MKKTVSPQTYSDLVADLSSLIERGRHTAVRSVNVTLVATSWLVGQRILEFEQQGRRKAVYGEELLVRLADDLCSRFGKGYSKSNLFVMRAFYLAYPAQMIFQTLSGKLTPASRKKVSQKSPVGLEWFDLLARRFVLGQLAPADFGQMNFYLNYLKEREKLPDENDPIGLILCSDKKQTVVEYALGGMSNQIFASKYKLQLPHPKLLQAEIEREKQKLLEMEIVADEK